MTTTTTTHTNVKLTDMQRRRQLTESGGEPAAPNQSSSGGMAKLFTSIDGNAGGISDEPITCGNDDDCKSSTPSENIEYCGIPN
eukprot:m.80304 g.80304  ORF g.80304 m.80304 type:complete len:84 (+) comp25300_c0_seq2:2-253(+)